jgi:hypothetical protein
MSWRSVQLEDKNCDQDNTILDLFQNTTVKYLGTDNEFASRLNLDNSSNNIVAVINDPIWLSDLVSFIDDLNSASLFYIGINRYQILGNDTSIEFDKNKLSGENIINLIKSVATAHTIIKSGFFDNDQGRYFNFVQPLTWAYGTNNNK